MPTYNVTRDQAVWEREFLTVNVPDDVQQLADATDDDMCIEDHINEQLAQGNFKTKSSPEIQDSLEGFDVVISFTRS